MKYGFIGVGHMGGAILRGFLASGAVDKEDAIVLGRTEESTRALADKYAVTPAVSGEQLADDADGNAAYRHRGI